MRKLEAELERINAERDAIHAMFENLSRLLAEQAEQRKSLGFFKGVSHGRDMLMTEKGILLSQRRLLDRADELSKRSREIIAEWKEDLQARKVSPEASELS